MDQACEVAWKHKDPNAAALNSQTGNFSYNFQDAVLRDIYPESGIIAKGSVSDTLEGDVHSCGSSSQGHTAISIKVVGSFQAYTTRPKGSVGNCKSILVLRLSAVGQELQIS